MAIYPYSLTNAIACSVPASSASPQRNSGPQPKDGPKRLHARSPKTKASGKALALPSHSLNETPSQVDNQPVSSRRASTKRLPTVHSLTAQHRRQAPLRVGVELLMKE